MIRGKKGTQTKLNAVCYAIESLESRILLAYFNLIRNGALTAPVSSSDWVATPAFYADNRFSNYHSSGGYAYLSNPDGSPGNNLFGTLYQPQLTIPANSTAVSLQFWYNITTQETTTTLANDTLVVEVQNNSGAPLATVTVYSNLNYTSGYAETPSFNLLPFAGQTVRLAFIGTTNASLPTVFRIDDVSLYVTTPAPTVSTGAASQIASSSAQLNGSVNPNGTSTSYWFDYGTTSSYGDSTGPVNVGAGTSTTAASATITGLNPSSTYYYRLDAENSYADVIYGTGSSFSTSTVPPSITLLGPNNGAIWTVGTNESIEWSFSGNTSNLSYLVVELSTNNGSHYAPISSPIELSPSTQSITYIPNGTQITSTAVVLVQAFNSSNQLITGATSSGPFAIEGSGYSSPDPSGLTPIEMREAYGLGAFGESNIGFGNTPAYGNDQTIAIVDANDDPTIVPDANAFSSYFGLPLFNGTGGPTLTVLNESGQSSPLPSPGDYSEVTEEALDVEWAHVIAPEANIVLVESSSASIVDQMTSVRTAANLPGVVAVSMSWGLIESQLGQLAEENYDYSYFVTPSGHIGGSGLSGGVTFIAATGDTGAPGLYPAYSPHVIAVGGTTLTVTQDIDGSYAYEAETGWGDSGGGVSAYETQPPYQASTVNGYTNRTIPDVAMDAGDGVPIYDTWDFGTITPWVDGVQVGTSLAAPMWAALIALADQGRASLGLGSLDGYSQTLPDLYNLPAADFHDITTGYNGYNAGAGYDLVTGLGSPIANLLVPALVGSVGQAKYLSFAPPPGNITAGNPFLPTVTVNVDDWFGDICQNDESTVTLSVYSGSGSLIGTTSVSATNGVATFSGITLTKTGDYELEATDSSLGAAISGSFIVAPAVAFRLAYSQAPTNTAVATSFSPDIIVDVYDQYGNLVTGSTPVVELSILSGSGHLVGTISVPVVGGVADFSNVSIDTNGQYTIEAADGSANPAVSNQISIYDPAGVSSVANALYSITGSPAAPTLEVVSGEVALTMDLSVFYPNYDLKIDSGGDVFLDATQHMATLQIANGAQLDITHYSVWINYGSGLDPISTISGQIRSGYNDGEWNGPGIISSTARNPTNGFIYGVGWADGQDGVVAGLSYAQIEIKYTLLGDANLDGVVNGSDFSIVAANFGLGVTNWDQGNFLYGSSVNGSDFAALAANFGQGDNIPSTEITITSAPFAATPKQATPDIGNLSRKTKSTATYSAATANIPTADPAAPTKDPGKDSKFLAKR